MFDPALIAIVGNAWRDTLGLPTDATELAMSWEAAGGDSIRTLELILNLETRLDRAIDFALIDPAMDVEAMAMSLAADAIARGANAPVVYLLPGISGDTPGLARFRSWFGRRLAVELVDLPSLDAPATLLASVAATAQFVADAITLRQPQGPIRLAGYSFGGSVAFEAARLLSANGRVIEFLGILDTPFGAAALGIHPAHAFSRRWRWLAHRTVMPLLMIAPIHRLSQIIVALLPPKRARAARQFFTARFRNEVRNRWQPQAIDCSAFVAASTQFEAKHLPIWQRLLPNASVVRLPGTHVAIFSGETLDRLATAFEAALTAEHRA